MKKITSIILLLTIISSCLVLNSCSLNDIFSFIAGEPTFDHSDNFTADDIEFVNSLHGNIVGRHGNERLTIASHKLSDIIHKAQNGANLFLMRFENPYIISAYIKPDADQYKINDDGSYCFDVSKYYWYKAELNDDFPEFINGTRKTSFTYLLYDCIVEKDIASGREYDYKCKFYLQYISHSSLERISKYMVMYFDGGDITKKQYKFISEVASEYSIHLDEENKKYFVIPGELYESHKDLTTFVADELLGDYYKILSPHLVRNDSLDRIQYIDEDHHYIWCMYHIDLDLFINLLFENN